MWFLNYTNNIGWLKHSPRENIPWVFVGNAFRFGVMAPPETGKNCTLKKICAARCHDHDNMLLFFAGGGLHLA